MNQRLALLFFSFSIILTAQSPMPGLAPEPKLTAPPTVEDIQSTTASVYGHCKTYQDAGTVETTYYEGRAPRTESLRFTTAFSRPDKFRFEFVQSRRHLGEMRFLIAREGGIVRSWWTIGGKEENPESLEGALAAATGVSSGSAYTVPMMLIADELKDPWSRRSLEGSERILDLPLDGILCFRLQCMRTEKARSLPVQGAPSQMPAYTSRKVYWIDQKSFRILQVEEWTDFGEFQTHEVTRYDAKLDAAVPDSAFTFDPPK